MERIKLNFRDLFREFVSNSDTITIEEDVIQNSDNISDEVKKELMAALKRTEKFAEKRTGIPQRIARPNHSKSIQETLEKNPIRVDEYQKAKKVGKKLKDDEPVQAQIIEVLKENEDNSREL